MIRSKTLALMSALLIVSFAGTAFAAHGEGKIPEVVELKVVKTEEPEALPDPRPVICPEHDLDAKDVEKLARLLWSSPLRDEYQKKCLVWVVMNRSAYGEPFKTSISANVNHHEFSFFDAHAHRSDENLRIVRQAMNEWLSAKDGYNPGTVIPRFAYYIQFYGENNRRVRLMDINRDILDWDPIK